MPRQSSYRGFYIRAYESIIADSKFFYFVDKAGKEEWKSVPRLIGSYLICLFILAKNTSKPGYAYDGGSPMSDRLSSRLAGLPQPEWAKLLKELVETKLLVVDKNGAWGIGENKFNIYMGAEINKRIYYREYQRKHSQRAEPEGDVRAAPQILPEA